MRPLVHREMAARLVRLVTLIAFVWLLAGMHARMNVQLGGRREQFATFIAPEILNALMAKLMVAQHHVVLEAFVALAAAERRFRRMGQHVRLEPVRPKEELAA